MNIQDFAKIKTDYEGHVASTPVEAGTHILDLPDEVLSLIFKEALSQVCRGPL